MTTPKWTNPATAADPAAELLTPPGEPVAKPPSAPPVATDGAYLDLAEAIRTGAVPTFVDETPAPPRGLAPPVDVEAERAAYQALIAFIHAHKDEGTTVALADPDDLMHGLD